VIYCCGQPDHMSTPRICPSCNNYLFDDESPKCVCAKNLAPEPAAGSGRLMELLRELDQWWTFDNAQQHTHSYHDKQAFLARWRAKDAGDREDSGRTQALSSWRGGAGAKTSAPNRRAKCNGVLGELAVSEDRLNTAMQDAAKATLALNDALAAHALLLVRELSAC